MIKVLTLLALVDIMSLCCKSSSSHEAASTVNTRLYYRTDATAGFSTAHKDAATNLIWPIIADQVKTVNEWIATLVEGAYESK